MSSTPTTRFLRMSGIGQFGTGRLDGFDVAGVVRTSSTTRVRAQCRGSDQAVAKWMRRF